jgi:hypothetical protein
MPPYAICITESCAFLHDYDEDGETGPSKLPPQQCPICKGKIIYFCHLCFAPLLSPPRKELPRCEDCGARLRWDITESGLSMIRHARMGGVK